MTQARHHRLDITAGERLQVNEEVPLVGLGDMPPEGESGAAGIAVDLRHRGNEILNLT
jgi:hypothetical protein